MKNNRQKKGFSLIELLVVISIMAILITIGITSLASVQRKSRDAKRKSDLREIKIALEQYYSVCGFVYPTPVAEYYDPIVCWSPTTVGMLETMPTDPRTGGNYYCGETCDEYGYYMCADMEAEATPYCVRSSQ
ncbi:hypothetical protein A2W14_07355 [Candidatus Gottesmanbacteria bacterium RBG_16_37_8]|uniref:Type II secretion system protein GspG C-terminal domain-containing protein n=1 Tax=Candidatus Gottesmanbacteria bacterium RBG_16_37_8 TaxID=1798371 RepID=A0A1F5YRF9_9BACT|nr:MAG: hypothetical protein A2W14_07355 [Candidatus Gottesmanbacteria bacterium RBG_16_37_8]